MTKRKRMSPPPSPASSPAEVYGPFLPPNTQVICGRICPIPPVACSGDETKRRMDAANAKPLDLTMLEAEPWAHAGGGCGFSLNGWAVGRARR
jgi:hypothetical protein